MSLENVYDTEMQSTLLNPLRRKLGPAYADCTYDNKTSHYLIVSKGVTACTPPPPRKNTGLWKRNTREIRLYRAKKDCPTKRSYRGCCLSSQAAQAVDGGEN